MSVWRPDCGEQLKKGVVVWGESELLKPSEKRFLPVRTKQKGSHHEVKAQLYKVNAAKLHFLRHICNSQKN